MAQHLHLALTLAGYLGGLLVLVGYGLTSTGRLAASSPAAQAVNTLGAALMLANGVLLAAWASVGVNAAWIGIGLLTLLRTRAARRGPRGPVEELPAGAVPTQPAGTVDHDGAGNRADGWAEDWDVAAGQLADAPTPAPEDDHDSADAADEPAASWPATAPLPVLDASGRPLR
ncbi:hypothetical protein WDZ17_09695 [Pseudokineococcus basanitobsidens]|uniref:CBU-0592-like domain-containing protein n=1 Tax=Pseudokineococcus basanitobsidens TaxID=1926649 RepID=A0ABU8RKG9_9ACTN